MIKKIDRCANNSENSSTIKLCEHIPCVNSMSTIWAVDHIEKKDTLNRIKGYKICESLREHAKI